MIIGKIVEGNKLYGNKDTMCVPVEGQDLRNELRKALQNISCEIKPIERAEKTEKSAEAPDLNLMEPALFLTIQSTPQESKVGAFQKARFRMV